jgi:hypothetical protein
MGPSSLPEFQKRYKKALSAFHKITEEAAKLVKADPVKKKRLLMFTQPGDEKPLDDLCGRFDYALHVMGKPQDHPDAAFKGLQTVYELLNANLKKNIDVYKKYPSDGSMMEKGCEVMINHLEAMRKSAKGQVESYSQMVKKASSNADKVKSQIKVCYLGIKKNIESTEGAMRLLKAKPDPKSVKNAFCSPQNVRGISAQVTLWTKTILKEDPSLTGKLGVDLGNALAPIFDASQNKDMGFWEQKLKMNKPGWEAAACAEAEKVLQQMKIWRNIAEKMKALAS